MKEMLTKDDARRFFEAGVRAGAGAESVRLPRHIELMIVHQPHAGSYQTVEQWLEINVDTLDATIDVTPEDRAAMLASGEVWEITWYPDTPIGVYSLAAATLERALERANDPGYR